MAARPLVQVILQLPWLFATEQLELEVELACAVAEARLSSATRRIPFIFLSPRYPLSPHETQHP